VERDAAGTKRRGALFPERALADGRPKTFFTNTSCEYWAAGASLIHADLEEAGELGHSPQVRLYLFAGTQHALGDDTPDLASARGDKCCLLAANHVDVRPLLRAALANLDRWVSQGVSPPPSCVPTHDGGTAVGRASVLTRFDRLNIPTPAADLLPQTWRAGMGAHAPSGVHRRPMTASDAYPTWVSAVDGSLNEVGGIRPLEVAVPLASYTGWNIAVRADGLRVLVPGLGAAIRMPKRRSTTDPRPSIEELYGDAEVYKSKARAAAMLLVDGRWMLHEDVQSTTEKAVMRFKILTDDRPAE
jgi:hypothetical protein